MFNGSPLYDTSVSTPHCPSSFSTSTNDMTPQHRSSLFSTVFILPVRHSFGVKRKKDLHFCRSIIKYQTSSLFGCLVWRHKALSCLFDCGRQILFVYTGGLGMRIGYLVIQACLHRWLYLMLTTLCRWSMMSYTPSDGTTNTGVYQGNFGKRLKDSLSTLNAFLCGCGHHQGDHSTACALSVAMAGLLSHCVPSDIKQTIAGGMEVFKIRHCRGNTRYPIPPSPLPHLTRPCLPVVFLGSGG